MLPGRFAVCRLEPGEEIPHADGEVDFFSVTRTDHEVSLVCREAPDRPGKVEGGWRCLEVEGPLEFDQIGVLAALAQPLAVAGVSIFAISTFDTDYLLVKEEQLAATIEALGAAGHSVDAE